jgi:hypothetical protein
MHYFISTGSLDFQGFGSATTTRCFPFSEGFLGGQSWPESNLQQKAGRLYLFKKILGIPPLLQARVFEW